MARSGFLLLTTLLNLALFSPLAAGLEGRPKLAYGLTDSVVGHQFYDFFNFEAISDPTHGRVEYVTEAVARESGTVSATDDTFIIKADDTTVLTPGGPGRRSARIISKKAFDTSVFVFDVRHMPQGCGTWPAIWTLGAGARWPTVGELDIVEGVNDDGANRYVIHSLNCTMPEWRPQLGQSLGNDCDVHNTNNAGCAVLSRDPLSYGPKFNQNGGGWYAVEMTPEYIKGWFWPRNSFLVPLDIKKRTKTVSPAFWGIPTAYFPKSKGCDLDARFKAQNIIINLTFCGDWAGAVYQSQGCPGTCVDYVNNNPGAFSKAYWDLASVRVYQ